MAFFSGKRLLPALLLFTLFAISYVQEVQARQMQAQRECVTCHMMWLDTFRVKGAVTLIDSIPMDEIMAAGAGEEKMCYSCHDGFVLDSRDVVWTDHRHPVFMKPSKNITCPRRNDGTIIFPLDNDGKVYCGTCHTAHGVAWDGKKED